MASDFPQAGFCSRPIPHWHHDSSSVAVRFVGRLPGDGNPARGEILRQLDAAPASCAWLRQEHAANVRHAAIGACGTGDGLWTQQPGLALSIVTADCVPIVCGCDQAVAAIHVGWRGLVAGVIEAALANLPRPSSCLEAWLGPAIGPCCYEVGDDVAACLTSAAEASIASPGTSGRMHIDLHRAAQFQLQRLGVTRVHRVETCTKCHPDLLWSHRGSTGHNGRNLTFAWLTN